MLQLLSFSHVVNTHSQFTRYIKFHALVAEQEYDPAHEQVEVL